AQAEDQIAKNGDLVLDRDVPVIDRQTKVGEPSRRREYRAKAPGPRMLGLQIARAANGRDLGGLGRGESERLVLRSRGIVEQWSQNRETIVVKRLSRCRDRSESVARVKRRGIKTGLRRDELFVKIGCPEVGTVIAAEAKLPHRCPLTIHVISEIRSIRFVMRVTAGRVELERLEERPVLEDRNVELSERLIHCVGTLRDPGSREIVEIASLRSFGRNVPDMVVAVRKT